MTVSVVLLTVGDQDEADLVRSLARAGSPTRLVRRCLDLGELVGYAQAGAADVALLGSDVAGLRPDLLARIRESGCTVAGWADSEAREQQLLTLGCDLVLRADLTEPTEIANRLAAAHEQLLVGRVEPAEHEDDDSRAGQGRSVALWGPTGSPGCTSVAVSMAREMAQAGRRVLLLDAHLRGGSLATQFGREPNGSVVTAARAAETGQVGVSVLRDHVQPLSRRSDVDVLDGVDRPVRSSEVGVIAFERVLRAALSAYEVVILDCGDADAAETGSEGSAELSRRALGAADVAVAVWAGRPQGAQRLAAQWSTFDALAGPVRMMVANQVGHPAAGRRPRAQVRSVHESLAPELPWAELPWEPDVWWRAERSGSLPRWPRDAIWPERVALLVEQISGLLEPHEERVA